jgi:thiamine biosynthesis lipoprotein
VTTQIPASLSRRKILLGAAGATAAMAGSRVMFLAAAAQSGLEVRTRAGLAFQTTVAITIAGGDARRLDQALDACFAGIRAVEQASSVYKPGSDVSRLNRDGRLTGPDPHVLTLLRYACSLSKATGGSYDPTVQPLWDIWAAHHARAERPSETVLRQTLRLVDWTGITISEDEISFDRPGMAVTLNSINQGYAADVVMDILAQHEITDAFVDTGECGASGHHPEGRFWRLGVPAPRDTSQLAFVIDPFRQFASTSGDYGTFFSPDFRDHHIFDPQTGYSPQEWSSITVTAPSGLIADGLSTALFVLDPANARRLLAGEPHCTARFFGKDGRECAGMA